MAYKLGVFVSAQELLEAGATKSAIRQYYRKNDVYTEVRGEELCDVTYQANEGPARANHMYFLPAKVSATQDATTIIGITKVVWGGSIKDSYVLVSTAS
jgi:hypothetical protein